MNASAIQVQIHGALVQMMQMNHGIFDEASISVIASDTVHEIAGLRPDVRRFRPNVVVRSLRSVLFQEDEWLGSVLSFGEGDDARHHRHHARRSLLDGEL